MKRKLSLRELLLILLLLVAVTGIAYRSAFYLPLQKELSDIAEKSQQLDEQIAQAAAKAATLDSMERELETFLHNPGNIRTEIAPFDNKNNVLAQLNSILTSSEEYSLQFSEPVTDDIGTVRRSVRMAFRCRDFASAKAIIREFSHCRWRCLISNLAISGSGDILSGPIEISATVTFLESTKLSP